MQKSLLLRLVIFLFLFVIMFVAYNSSNVYGANEKDVSGINKMLQSGFDELDRWNSDAAIKYFHQAISLDEK